MNVQISIQFQRQCIKLKQGKYETKKGNLQKELMNGSRRFMCNETEN